MRVWRHANDSTVTPPSTTLPMPTLPPTRNQHVVIPLLTFVLGFPVLVISLLCIIQQRNKCLQQRHMASASQSLQRYSMSVSGIGSLLSHPATLPMPTLPPTRNQNVVIPLLTFVLGFPVLVISLLCIIQQRNKCLQQRHMASASQSLQRYSMSVSGIGSLLSHPATLPMPTLPPTRNQHVVIPLLTFVLGFPVLVISLLCIIQQRNKCLQQRHMASASQSLQRYSMSVSGIGSLLSHPATLPMPTRNVVIPLLTFPSYLV